jgi:hypothetical protein
MLTPNYLLPLSLLSLLSLLDHSSASIALSKPLATMLVLTLLASASWTIKYQHMPGTWQEEWHLYLAWKEETPLCKRRGRIYGGNQSVFTRCEILASNEMSGYEGCVKEEGEAVC